MKKDVLFVLFVAVLTAVSSAHTYAICVQDTCKAKAVLYLNGKQKKPANAGVVEGFLVSPMYNDPETIEISNAPGGKKYVYASEAVDSLIIDDDLVYVRHKCRIGGSVPGMPKTRWVRRVYKGHNIDVYSAAFVNPPTGGGDATGGVCIHYWYVSISGDVAFSVSSQNSGNLYHTAMPEVNNTKLSLYFGKVYDYPEFAARIESGEFAMLSDAVRAWEKEYSSRPIQRADNKTVVRSVAGRSDAVRDTDSQVIQEGNIHQQAKRKRVFAENAFPRYKRIVNVGVSPDVASWSRRIRHSEISDCKLYVPPVSLSFDICWFDFNRFGSIGTVFSIGYSRFGYDWTWYNGHRDVNYRTRCNRYDVEAGGSYHVTICRNFEAYIRAMADIIMITDLTVDSDTGEKSIANTDFGAYVSFAAVAGFRYYFCRSVGVYVEGGYDVGYVAAGFTFSL